MLDEGFEYRDAARLAATVEDYWRGQGYAVTVSLVPGLYTISKRGKVWELRSNTINGRPITAKPARPDGRNRVSYKPDRPPAVYVDGAPARGSGHT